MKKYSKLSGPDLIHAMGSPAGLAVIESRGIWQMFPHLKILNRRLIHLEAGATRRLLILMPPQHGKSVMVSKYLPSWALMRDPNRRVILASYEESFAQDWGRRSRDVIEGFGGPNFGFKIKSDVHGGGHWEMDGYEGGMTCAGAGGSITGRSADLLIVDDPHKNMEEASSETMNTKVWEWFLSTALTRLSKTGIVAVIMTRWCEDDLAGRILREDAKNWDVLRLPAVCEVAEEWETGWTRKPGQALCEELHPAAELEERRKTMGSFLFEGLYQCNPSPRGGGIFKKTWFQYYSEPRAGCYRLPNGREVDRTDLRKFCTVDPAVSVKTSSDYSVVSVWGAARDGSLLLLDVVRDRLQAPDLIPVLQRVAERWDTLFVGIESVAFQLAICQMARNAGINVMELKPDKDKIARSLPLAAAMEGGRILFPTSASWLGDVESELLSFPQGQHDDIVDAASYAANAWQKFGFHRPTEEGGGTIRYSDEDDADGGPREEDEDHPDFARNRTKKLFDEYRPGSRDVGHTNISEAMQGYGVERGTDVFRGLR